MDYGTWACVRVLLAELLRIVKLLLGGTVVVSLSFSSKERGTSPRATARLIPNSPIDVRARTVASAT